LESKPAGVCLHNQLKEKNQAQRSLNTFLDMMPAPGFRKWLSISKRSRISGLNGGVMYWRGSAQTHHHRSFVREGRRSSPSARPVFAHKRHQIAFPAGKTSPCLSEASDSIPAGAAGADPAVRHDKNPGQHLSPYREGSGICRDEPSADRAGFAVPQNDHDRAKQKRGSARQK
jgi:hypothetical protein